MVNQTLPLRRSMTVLIILMVIMDLVFVASGTFIGGYGQAEIIASQSQSGVGRPQQSLRSNKQQPNEQQNQQSTQPYNPFCKICHSFLSYLYSHPPKFTYPSLEVIALQYCRIHHLQSSFVCRGAINEMLPFIIGSVWQKGMDGRVRCHQIGMCKRESRKRDVMEDVNRILGSGNQAGLTENEQAQQTLDVMNNKERKPLKVIHISDVHIDLDYTFGAEAKCSQPVCCRAGINSEDLLDTITLKANYWGTLSNCDLPIQTLNLFLEQLAQIKPDLIIWTGDNTPHDIWKQTQSSNLEYTVLIAEKIKRHTNARVLAAMGNHESWPVNVYDYQGDREKVLVAGLAEAWRQWLGEEAYMMQREKGYYVLVLKQFNNLKVISLNTQAGNDQNWFLLRDPTDPGNMLQWLQTQLMLSQQQNQPVWLIGHIAPRSSLQEWSLRFNALVERYSKTIRAQFFGHSHSDQLGMYTSFKDPEQVVAYYMIAPSLTTYSDRNPQFRVLDIDADTFEPIDFIQYRLDLSLYTLPTQSARFTPLYSFQAAYNLPSMSLSSLTSLFTQLRDNPAIQRKYTYYRASGRGEGQTGKNVYCGLMTVGSRESICMGGKGDKEPFEKLAGVWREYY